MTIVRLRTGPEVATGHRASSHRFEREVKEIGGVRPWVVLCLWLLVSLGSGTRLGATGNRREPSEKIGSQVAPFQVQDFRGHTHRLGDYAEAKLLVLAFLGTECPLARLYGPRLSELSHIYQPSGVEFLGINSNSQDSLTEIAAYARRHKIDFPILKDLGNELADALGAERTPEVFVLDQQRRIRYWGRIDDQYGVGYARERPSRVDLRRALDELLAGQPVSVTSQPSVGCHIGRLRAPTPTAEITYTKQISRILQKHCVECHRAGEIAPFALTEYDEVVGWSDTIAEVIRQQRMPPWHANAAYGEFQNSRTMTNQEKELVYQWVASGSPNGNPAELPPPADFTLGWRLPRQPDQVIAMRDEPFQVPAQGTVEYQYFVVDPGFREDKWISAAEVIPGNRSVVHHAIVFVRPPDGLEEDGIGWLAAYVPGNARLEIRDEYARLIPAGSKLVFQLHYTPVGSVQADTTKLGLVFADPTVVEKRVMTLLALQRDFEIPPHSAKFRVETMFDDFPAQSELLAMGPHMHLRGRSFRFIACRDDQRDQVLLDVPTYDFNWQHLYQLRSPIPAGDGVRLRCVAHFDNSENNLSNPDPTTSVRWGDQTWQEMMLGYLEVAVPVDGRESPNVRRQRKREQRIAQAAAKSRRMFQRFDSNGDGLIATHEVPETFMVFAFPKIDKNGNGTITLQEAVASGSSGD